jgi:hypothetical protein
MRIKDEAGGANPSYQGYDYQKLVTVWVALTLIFGPDACADEVIVEPASHDDVKARLVVPEDDADSNLTAVAGDELHVQIKFRGAGHWSAKDFAGVVNDKPGKGKRGPVRRSRAKDLLLREPQRRYVFITNTSVDGALSKGRVSGPAERPESTFLPTNLNLNAEQKAKLSGRFALIEQMTPPETRRRIDQLLTERLHVPTQNLDLCVSHLKRLVEDRFLEVPDPLRRADIEKIAEGLGGLAHANPNLAHYVPPANWIDADSRLKQKGAVLLVGPSGYGKSLTAESLVDDRRQANPPFRIVREIVGISGIEEAFATPGRVLFHLEDPWGQSGLDKDAAARWTSRLITLIRQASAEKQFVITSRSEIYREALGEAPAPLWSDRAIVIDDSAYDLMARRSILYGNLTSAGSWRQDLARQHEERLLRNLRTPLEINTFTRELRAALKPADANIDKLIDRALTDSRKHVVMEHVRSFGDRGVGGAAVLWALLRFSRGLQPDRLRMLRRTLDRASGPDVALDDLADHLAQTQLEVRSDGAFIAHSKVVEALESLACTYPRTAETALNAVAAAACELAAGDPNWLDELQRLVDGARAQQNKGIELEDKVIAALDAFLTESLTYSLGKPSQFRSAWQAASSRLSGNTPIGQLVQWLDRGVPRENGQWDFGWRPPKTTKADLQAVLAADPSLTIVKGFIYHILPSTNEHYHANDLLPWLMAFGVDLTKAFLTAGKEVVRATRFVMSADAISECALAWPAPPYDEVWAQILKLDAAVDLTLTASKEKRRQAWQGELDFAEQLFVQEQTEEEGPSATNYARGYVRARRRQEGFSWIPLHPMPDLVLPLWAELMRTDPASVTAAEIDAFFLAAKDDDPLQAEGLRVIGERRLLFARERVSAALTTGGPKALEAAVHALSWLESDGNGSSGRQAAEPVLLRLMRDLSSTRAAMLAPRIAGVAHGPAKASLASRVLAASQPSARAAVHLTLSQSLGADNDTLIQRFRELAPGEAGTLMAEGPRGLARLLLLISAVEGLDISTVARTWIVSDDGDDAQTAIAALAQAGGSANVAIIASALTHPEFSVRRKAIQELAPDAVDTCRLRIFEMANDASAPVRATVAQVIGEQGWSDGLDTLLSLLHDTRNYARHPERQRRDEPEYHVARAAADALARFDSLPAPMIDAILEFLDVGDEQPIDVTLHAKLLDLLTKPDTQKVWRTLERALKDDHVVGGADENLYPIRYAAAWSIVLRLSNRPFEIDLAPWTDVEASADHLDSQLAAPALLALGFKLEKTCDASTLQALRGSNSSPARVALGLSMIDDRDCAQKLAVQHDLLPGDHPLFDNTADISTDKATFKRWPLSENGLEWLSSLADGTDVERVLLFVMAQRTGVPLGNPDFEPWALRRRATIPITTFAELFGME